MSDTNPAKAEEIRVALCPMCGKPREMTYRPFCSKRCADLDLGRWFNGSYAMPAAPDEDEDGIEHDLATGAGQQRDLS